MSVLLTISYHIIHVKNKCVVSLLNDNYNELSLNFTFQIYFSSHSITINIS